MNSIKTLPTFGQRDPDARGYYGAYGGRFVPETLVAPVAALEAAYIEARSDPAFHETLKALFSQSEAHVGLVLCERLVNMPVQVVPPMYSMLANEIKWANADVCAISSLPDPAC